MKIGEGPLDGVAGGPWGASTTEDVRLRTCHEHRNSGSCSRGGCAKVEEIAPELKTVSFH